MDLHSPYCRYLRHPFEVIPQVLRLTYGYTTDQLVEYSYFTIGLVTQWNLLGKVHHYPPVLFRQRDANIANLSASAWAKNYSHSVLLPILAIALTRLYCDTVWIDLYHCQGFGGPC